MQHNQQLLNSMSLIEWDLPRTYPTLGITINDLRVLLCCVHLLSPSLMIMVVGYLRSICVLATLHPLAIMSPYSIVAFLDTRMPIVA